MTELAPDVPGGRIGHNVCELRWPSPVPHPGRTYTISGSVTFIDSDMDGSDMMEDTQESDTTTCPFSIEIHVPHDKGKHKGKN